MDESTPIPPHSHTPTPAAEALALYQEARERWESGNASGALVRYQRCLERLARLGDRRWQGQIEREVGEMHHDLYELARALAAFERALDHFTAAGDRREAALTHYQIGRVHQLAGDYDAAQAAFARALEGSRAVGDPRAEGLALAGLGQSLWEAGSPEAGLPQMLSGLALLLAAQAPEAARTRDQLRYWGAQLPAARFRELVESATTDPALRAAALGDDRVTG